MPVVYILTNESMPDTIKIGIAENLENRIKSLDSTGVPLPFECYYAVEVDDSRSIEQRLHETFDDERVRPNREFFYCTPEQAKSALSIAEVMGGRNVTPDEPILETEQDRHSLVNARSRRENIDYFGILGIEVGEILTFDKDKTITCEVAEDNKIHYKGKITSLSGAALEILHEMGKKWPRVSGATQWCHKGKKLTVLYQEIGNN